MAADFGVHLGFDRRVDSGPPLGLARPLIRSTGMELGRIGVWAGGPWRDRNRVAEAQDVAAELESLGYGTLWLSGGFKGPIQDLFEPLLDATKTMTIASGITSIWHTPPDVAKAAFAEFERAFPGRFLLGIGASHATYVERSGTSYDHPYTHMVEYLDALDEGPRPVPTERRILAALGPRMLRLSADRSLGAHSYFVPVEHTKLARQTLGDRPVLAPEQAVIVERDRQTALRAAREYLNVYLALPNYTSNLRRLGFTDADLEPPGPESTADRLVFMGDAPTVARRVGEHFSAGADHVCLQVFATDPSRFPRSEYAELAELLC
jgi:probable F420-dependent oxidoreductase